MIRFWLVACAAALCLASGAAAQPETARYRFVRYGTEAGLPSELTVDVAQDSAGFVWVGTRDGVARLDGTRARVWRHRPGSEAGLPSSLVGAVHVDRAGTVWVGTSFGLARYDPASGQFERFAEEALRAAGGGPISAIASDEGGLWVGFNGVAHRVRYDGTVDRVPNRIGFVLTSPRQGEVWAHEALCRLRDNPVRCQPVGARGVRTLLTVWSEDSRTLGVTARGEVWELSPMQKRIETWEGLGGLSQIGFARYSAPRLWVATVDGLFVYDTERQRLSRIGAAEGIASRDIRRVEVDRQGGVWVSTGRGVYRWGRPNPAFQAVTAADGLPDPRVNGITTVDGDTYVGTNGGLFRRAADGTWTGFFAGDRAYVNGVWQVTPASGGGLWVGGKAFGVRRLWPDEGRWEQVAGPGQALNVAWPVEVRVPARGVLEAGGRVWVASSNGLAVRDRGGEWSGFKRGEGEGDGLPTTVANVVHVDRAERVWVGTDVGLVEATPARGPAPRGPGANAAFRQVAVPSLVRPVVWDVAESPDDPGTIWIATVGTGACRLEPEADRVRCFTTADGLPSNAVHRIEAGGGALWIGTDRGLARLTLEGVASGADSLRVTTFSRADGLHGDIVDLMSSHRDADGRLYFGGPGGYTVFDPEAVALRETPPAPRFTSLTVGGLSRAGIASGDTIRLPADARRFAVAFATLDFTAPERNRYRFRLLPLEAEWTAADARAAEARYAALPPGTYVLEVEGTGYAGGFDAAPARLVVEVPPRWWERGAVRALGFLLALGAVGGVGWAALRRSERKREEVVEVARQLASAREAERLRLARDLHDGAMQHLYRTGHDLDRLAADPDEKAGVRAGLDEAAGDLRAVLRDIRPPHLGTLGVRAALEATTRPFGRTYPDLDLDLDLRVTGRDWPAPVQTAAYRIAQEALSNAGRHAGASGVRVTLREDGGHAVVEVADDGRGFDATTPDVDHVRAAHFGLAGLRERAAALGGEVEIDSAPGEGTRVLARLPLAQNGRAGGRASRNGHA